MRNLANGGDDRFASHLSRIMHSIIGRALHTHTHTHTLAWWPMATGLCCVSLTRWTSCIVYMIYNSRVPNKSRPDGASEKEGRRRRREHFSSFLSLLPSAAVFLSFFLSFFFCLVLDEWQKQSEVGDLRLQPPLSWRHKKKKKKTQGQVNSSATSANLLRVVNRGDAYIQSQDRDE